MADVNALTKHLLRRCRTDGNTAYLDALGAGFDSLIVDRSGMVVGTGSANGQSFSFVELVGLKVQDVIYAKEAAYGLYAELDDTQLANLLDRSPQRKTSATYCY